MHRFNSILVIITLSASAMCQDMKNDLLLIEKKEYSFVLKDNNYRSENNVNNKNVISYRHLGILSKLNPLRYAASGAMLFYQYIASPQFFRYCLYHRSCSNYGKKAIEEFGLIKGLFITADRLLRCNFAAIQDFPVDDVDVDGLIYDEPAKYRLKPFK